MEQGPTAEASLIFDVFSFCAAVDHETACEVCERESEQRGGPLAASWPLKRRLKRVRRSLDNRVQGRRMSVRSGNQVGRSLNVFETSLIYIYKHNIYVYILKQIEHIYIYFFKSHLCNRKTWMSIRSK